MATVTPNTEPGRRFNPPPPAMPPRVDDNNDRIETRADVTQQAEFPVAKIPQTKTAPIETAKIPAAPMSQEATNRALSWTSGIAIALAVIALGMSVKAHHEGQEALTSVTSKADKSAIPNYGAPQTPAANTNGNSMANMNGATNQNSGVNANPGINNNGAASQGNPTMSNGNTGTGDSQNMGNGSSSGNNNGNSNPGTNSQ